MKIPLLFRRSIVILGVLLSLFVGVATIQAAAAWTAAASPLADKPPSIESLKGSLETAQERSTALQSQLDELNIGSTELVAALEAARERIAADATQAKELRSSLKAAKTKLAALERSIQRARSAAARVTVTVTRSTSASTPVAHEVEHETEDD
jgi:DNA repair exonuclease SbcCD ATPase subunit